MLHKLWHVIRWLMGHWTPDETCIGPACDGPDVGSND
jgi:hypothetical protein